MQSRISWHICAVNMLPSSGRFSVSQPIGPSSLYKIVSNAMTEVAFQRMGFAGDATPLPAVGAF
jgi:hypothetical protein